VDARLTEGRERFRANAEALGALEHASTASAPAPAMFSDVIAAAFGPGEVATAWRRWREARVDEGGGELDRLERGVEEAQRQASRVAAWMDALAREEDAIRGEMEALRRCVADAAADHATAADLGERVRQALAAIEIARLRATPTRGAALDADAAVLAGLAEARAADARAFERAAARFSALVGVGTEALGLCARLRAALEQVHAEGTDVLHTLDTDLGQLAAEARAADLGRSIGAGMATLRGSVGRVHLQAREGTDRLLHRLDRLAEAPDLLAPADPARAAAEAEVASLLSPPGARRD
jgi:hypothetical protein